MSYLHSRHFSIEEANNILDEIKPLVEETSNLRKSLIQRDMMFITTSISGARDPTGKATFLMKWKSWLIL
jgi:hypothetical protein